MFKSWRIENIKSYGGAHDIPLSMINIIAGANSSGKSTLIQSVLLLKQTIQYGNTEKSLLLNGPLLRLGSFDEVLTSSTGEEESPHKTLSIGFDMEFTAEAMRKISTQWMRTSQLLRWTAHRPDYLAYLKCDISWKRHKASETGGTPQGKFLPDVDSVKIISDTQAKDGLGRQFISLLSPEKAEVEHCLAPFVSYADEISQAELIQNRPDADVIGGYIDRFLPQYIGVRYNAAAKKAGEIASYLFDRGGLLPSHSQHAGTSLPESVTEFLIGWLTERGVEVSVDEIDTVEEARAKITALMPATGLFAIGKFTEDPALEKSSVQAREIVRARLIEDLPAETDYDFILPGNIRTATQVIQEIFREGVRYLGPLRDPPRPVYPLEALPSSTDVGYRGEHTAAVLDLNKEKTVAFYLPPSGQIDDDYITSAIKKTLPLHKAVELWLQYLGVAEAVETQDEGVFGNRLQVSTSSGLPKHDLTNVGVGVSQILPIIVMSLLARPESLLIFEQPELHLHPRVQARLADFFLSLAIDGKQILAETHSEYMIDRFRLRVALGEDAKVNSIVSIMFSERRAGLSKLREIVLTEFGSIVEWPDEFFDQSQGDVARILKAASRKRAARRKADL